MMKICLKCKKKKKKSEFLWRNQKKGWLKPYCIDCNRIYDLQRYQITRSKRLELRKINTQNYLERINEFLAKYLLKHPCVDCGEKDIRFLEFDHINNKNHNISNMLYRRYSWKTILKEIKLCEVRCIKCHRLKTYAGINAWRLRMYEKYQK